MDNDQHMSSDITMAESNLSSVLFPDFNPGNLILTSDGLSSLEGALCFDETNNELVYMPVQMLSNINNADSVSNSNIFSSFGNSISSLSDLSLFNDGGQVMLLTGGSIVVPNDEDNVISSNTDPFILECVLNGQEEKFPDSNSKLLLTSGTDRKNCDGKVSKSDSAVIVEENEKKKVCYSCKICSEKFTQLKDYKKHLLSHKDDKMHQCKFCENSFNKINNLILHEAIHTNETRCPLPTCQKRFNRKASLKAHIKIHEEDESLICTECGEEFRNQLYLELHYKYQSQCRASIAEPIAPQTKSYECKLCNRNFEDVDSFNNHKKEHDKIKKALATKSHRRKSICTVPSSRINRCKICSKWFRKPSQLVRHMRIHTGERPFVCTVCNKAFNQANSLKIHMLKHTGDRPFQCTFCLTSFSQRGNLRQHINRVHSIPKVEENVYKCTECSCIFKKMCSLNAHKNRVHLQRYFIPQNNDAKNCDRKQSTDNNDTPTTSITIENGIDDLNDEDMNILLDKETSINTISIMFDNGSGGVCSQKVFVKKKENSRYYKCSHCPKLSLKLKEIIRHLKYAILGKPFKCDYCSKMFSQQLTFLTHLTLHATAKVYQCHLCDKNFSNPIEMKIHAKTHALQVQQLCINCLKTFTQSELETHQCVPLVHETVTEEDNDVIKVRDTVNLILPPYDCKSCNITLDSYARLKQHLHGKHDAVICETCCLQFPCKEKLKEHEVGHHEEEIRDRTCSKCNKKFQTKYRRDLHFQSHFRDHNNDVKCQSCSKMFKDESSLGKHMKKFHDHENAVTVNMEEKSNKAFSSSDLNDQNCDVNLKNQLDMNGPFVSGDVYVSCSGSNINCDNNSIDKTQNIVSNGSNFALDENDEFPTSSANITETDRNDFPVDGLSIFPEPQVLNENNENSDNLKDDLLQSSSSSLPSQVLSLDSIDDNLFDFPSSVIPVEVSSADSVTTTVLNVPGAVIYRCTKCFQQYFTELDLQKHFQASEACNNGMPNISDTYFYACNTCYLSFKNLSNFLRHLQTHDGTKTYECLYCGAENKTQAQLTHHIAQHSLQKEFPCVHCGELFDSLEVVKQHITDIHLMSSVDKKVEPKRKKNYSSDLLLSEKEKILFACQKTHKYSSISEKVLSSLLKNSSEKDLPSCDIKEDKTKKKKSEIKKLQTENICSHCGRPFKKRCDLVRHIRIHTGEKPFKCDYCSKCFTVKSILNCHLKTHFSVNNIFCHVCNRFFSTVGSLKTHMRLHTGERPYKCWYCKETFRTSGHRDSHLKRHSGSKAKTKSGSSSIAMIEIEDNVLDLNLDAPSTHITTNEYIISDSYASDNFKFQDIDLADLSNLPANKRTNNCAICRKTFKKKSDLDRHINTHVNEKGFHCVICDAKFNQLDTFKNHLKKHTGDQQFICDKCDGSFASAKNLKTHKIRHHPESLNLPIKDANEKRLEVIENDKDVNKWEINVEIFNDKNEMKKFENVNDFFIIDKQYDLSSIMMQDLFPDDEK